MRSKNCERRCVCDWNMYTYEKTNKCCNCNGSLVLTRKTGTTQEFVCSKCKQHYRLNLATGNISVVEYAIAKSDFFEKSRTHIV